MSATQHNTVDKATAKKKVAVPDFDQKKDQVIIGTGTHRHLHEGVEYPASGADAAALIEAGHATLKTGK